MTRAPPFGPTQVKVQHESLMRQVLKSLRGLVLFQGTALREANEDYYASVSVKFNNVSAPRFRRYFGVIERVLRCVGPTYSARARGAFSYSFLFDSFYGGHHRFLSPHVPKEHTLGLDIHVTNVKNTSCTSSLLR